MTQRIQRRRTKGWRMPEGAIYVGRPTIWGNPYRVIRQGKTTWEVYAFEEMCIRDRPYGIWGGVYRHKGRVAS